MDVTGEFGLEIDSVVEHAEAQLSEVRLHYVEAGDPDGDLVILLHGFPEFWYSWRHQIAALSSAGYHVVAPDQRGYNTSDKPPNISDYETPRMAKDVAELLDHFGVEKAYIVGHDWGAMVAWMFAMKYPDRTRKLTIMNVPHPVKMLRGLKTVRQLRKSWYIGFFQLPVLPEKAIAANDYAVLRKMFRRDPVNEHAFSEDDIDRYVKAMSQPGALKSAINWYRASRKTNVKAHLAEIDTETLVIWGTQDTALGEELAEPPSKWVKNYRVEKLPDASHWVQCDRPEKVNALLLHFLAS